MFPRDVGIPHKDELAIYSSKGKRHIDGDMMVSQKRIRQSLESEFKWFEMGLSAKVSD